MEGSRHGFPLYTRFKGGIPRAPRLSWPSSVDLRRGSASWHPTVWATPLGPTIGADLLGHSSVPVTLDWYSHVAMAMHKWASGALGAVLQDDPARRVGSVVEETPDRLQIEIKTTLTPS